MRYFSAFLLAILVAGGCSDRKGEVLLSEEIGIDWETLDFFKLVELSGKKWLKYFKSELKNCKKCRFLPQKELERKKRGYIIQLSITPYLKYRSFTSAERLLEKHYNLLRQTRNLIDKLPEDSEKRKKYEALFREISKKLSITKLTIYGKLILAPADKKKESSKKFYIYYPVKLKRDDPLAVVEHLKREMPKIISLLSWRIKNYFSLKALPPEQIIKKIEGLTPPYDLKKRALLYNLIKLLGEKKPKHSAKYLQRFLKKHRDPALILEVISSVVKIKDPSLASSLIQFGRKSEGAFLLQIISALGELGGEEAKSYLFTLSNAHPNPTVRKTANEVFLEILAKEKSKGKR